MKSAKLWLQVFTAGFVVIVALLIVTLYTPIAYGDLSRIGQVSEHEFGWQREPLFGGWRSGPYFVGQMSETGHTDKRMLICRMAKF